MTTLRIITFNIRHGRGLDEQIDLDRTAALIRASGADIALLQEVDNATRRSGGVDQAAALAEKTALPYHGFGRNITYAGGGYGNAILSRFPLGSVSNHLLPRLPVTTEQRGALFAEVQIGEHRITLINTHYPLTRLERCSATRYLLGLIGKVSGPLILGGDLNAEDTAPEIISLRSALIDPAPLPAAPTFPADVPTSRIDYLLYRGPDVTTSFAVLETLVSDHRPVLMELALTEQ